MLGEGEACALWAGCVCAEGGAGTWTRRGIQPTEGEQPGRRAQKNAHPPLVKTEKQFNTSEPLEMKYLGFLHIPLFNSINRVRCCVTPKIPLAQFLTPQAV